jgi:hypothetical protein
MIDFDGKFGDEESLCEDGAQEGRRREVCADNLQRKEENDEWLNRVIAGDESWVFQYCPETK